MNAADSQDVTTLVLSRAAQYDIQLITRSTPESQSVFAWRWHTRDLGPPFSRRDLAIAWMAEWLDADTESQQAAWFVPSEREQPGTQGNDTSS